MHFATTLQNKQFWHVITSQLLLLFYFLYKLTRKYPEAINCCDTQNKAEWEPLGLSWNHFTLLNWNVQYDTFRCFIFLFVFFFLSPFSVLKWNFRRKSYQRSRCSIICNRKMFERKITEILLNKSLKKIIFPMMTLQFVSIFYYLTITMWIIQMILDINVKRLDIYL